MSYDHALNFSATLKTGTSVAMVLEAIRPIIDYFGLEGNVFANKPEKMDFQFQYDELTQELYVYTCGDVGDSYESVVEESAELIGHIAAEAGSCELDNHNTCDLENATTVIYFGENTESIKLLKMNRAVNGAMYELNPFLHENQRAEIEAMLKLAIGLTA